MAERSAGGKKGPKHKLPGWPGVGGGERRPAERGERQGGGDKEDG